MSRHYKLCHQNIKQILMSQKWLANWSTVKAILHHFKSSLKINMVKSTSVSQSQRKEEIALDVQGKHIYYWIQDVNVSTSLQML